MISFLVKNTLNYEVKVLRKQSEGMALWSNYMSKKVSLISRTRENLFQLREGLE